jgi:hypothetical protein
MKKLVLFIGSVLLLTSLACGFNFSTASIQSAVLARDADGNDPTNVFAQQDTFYLVAESANAPDDTAVKAIWMVIEADDVEPGYVLDERELTGGSNSLHFSVENDLLWPVGRYKVELYLNGELDRTLEFSVEGDVISQAEPSPTPEPLPTDTPAPTATQPVEGSGGDTITLKSTATPVPAPVPSTEEPAAEPEPLPFRAEPYTHASGAFSLAVPTAWEKVDEDEFSVAFGDNQSRVGVIFVDMGAPLSEDELLEFVDSSKDIILDTFTDSYEVIGDKNSLADSGFYYLGLSFDDGDGAADMFYEPRDNIIFILYFASLQYEALDPTWTEIINSYQIDAGAVAASAPPPAENAAPEPPPPPPGPSVPAGKGMLIYYNYTNQDFVIDIIGPTADSAVIPPNSQKEFVLDPGNYQYNGHSPGGQYVINTTDFVITEGQITEKGVQ